MQRGRRTLHTDAYTQEALQDDQQKVGLNGALVHFIDEQAADARELPVALESPQQHTRRAEQQPRLA